MGMSGCGRPAAYTDSLSACEQLDLLGTVRNKRLLSATGETNHRALQSESVETNMENGPSHKFGCSKTTLLLLALFISALFFSMIRQFLIVILLAGIFSAMFQPLYQRFVQWFKGRRNLASLIIPATDPCDRHLAAVSALRHRDRPGHRDISTRWGRGWPIKSRSRRGFTDYFRIAAVLRLLPAVQGPDPQKDRRTGGSISTFLIENLARGTIPLDHRLHFSLPRLSLHDVLFSGRTANCFWTASFYPPCEPRRGAAAGKVHLGLPRATIKGTLVIGVIQGGWPVWHSGPWASMDWFSGGGDDLSVGHPSGRSALVWVPAVIILAA